MGVPSRRSSHEVDQTAHERRMGARRRSAHHRIPSSLGGLHRLGVEIPEHLHVVAHEAERHDHHGLDTLIRQVSITSLTSGSSHGWDGGPDRLW